MKNFARHLVWFLMALGVTACGSVVRSNVTTFHQFPKFWEGKNVAVLPYKKELLDSLEWRSYKQAVANRLRKASFMVTDPDDADWLVFFGYAIDRGREVTSTYSIPQYGITGYRTGTITNYGGGSTTYSGTTTVTPTYGITGYSTGINSSIVYTRSMSIEIIEKISREKFWEMKLQSQGSCGTITPVMPYLIEAAFDGFPGPNGKSRVIEIPLKDGNFC